MNIKIRLVVMNFLQFAVWGAYLISMGSFLSKNGMAQYIGWFYSIQGIVSLFMPALIGIVADRWIEAQKLLGVCHGISGLLMLVVFYIGLGTDYFDFITLFIPYTFSVAFYMPTLALSNSVAYTSLEISGLDIVKDFPPIRVFGTVGFICSMLVVNFAGFQGSSYQFFLSGVLSLILCFYSLSLPKCSIRETKGSKSLSEVLGLKAFTLFKDRKMALFFIFSMLLGICLQITNAFANPYISGFEKISEYSNTFGAKNANALISISQISETLCILLIPFFLKRFGIKKVMLIAMIGWVLRFAFLGLGNPGSGVWLFLLSMIVYGMAFDFFNVSGSLFVDKETSKDIRSSAQGLFMLMTNGIGATVGTLVAQFVVNKCVGLTQDGQLQTNIEGWQISWLIFASYSLVVAVAFAILFKYKHTHITSEVS